MHHSKTSQTILSMVRQVNQENQKCSIPGPWFSAHPQYDSAWDKNCRWNSRCEPQKFRLLDCVVHLVLVANFAKADHS